MRYNVFSYLLVEGFRNVFKNKKSTAASLMIMCATMLIFGLFFIIGENINHIMVEIEEAQGMQVFIKTEATEEQIKDIGERIRAIPNVNKVEFVSKESALKQMTDKLQEKSFLLAGFEENNIFPASYVVTLTDLKESKNVQQQILGMDPLIKKITSRDDVITKLIQIANGVRIATGVILVLLVVISTFIISNTIKLTVHARRKEISIMKYVGATNSFIRWPFIVEGIIIGIISAALSVLVLGLAYNSIAGNLLQNQVINITLLSFADMFNLIMIVYILLGIGIGVVGSSISMRKYLNV